MEEQIEEQSIFTRIKKLGINFFNEIFYTEIFNILSLMDFTGNDKAFYEFLLSHEGSCIYKNIYISFIRKKTIDFKFDKIGDNYCANFGFNIKITDNEIIFSNHHRLNNAKRRAGLGTQYLEETEEIFRNLGIYLSKKIKIEFVWTQQQTDTQNWLLKNGYTKVNDNYFYKNL